MTEINTREIAAQLVRDHGPDVDASTIDEALLDDYSLDERTPDDQRDALVEEIHKLIQEHPWERQ
jgi:isocitrate dehydrogenase kinase/phosphatase